MVQIKSLSGKIRTCGHEALSGPRGYKRLEAIAIDCEYIANIATATIAKFATSHLSPPLAAAGPPLKGEKFLLET